MELYSRYKNISLLSFIIIILATSLFTSCSGKSGTEIDIMPIPAVPENLFGATIQWNSMADKTGEYGELIRDRSFRTLDPASPSFHPGGFVFVSGKINVWNELQVTDSVDSVEFANSVSSDPAENYPGGRSYPGYLRIKQEGYYTGINQTLFTNLKNNTSYTLLFSSFGVNVDSNTRIGIYLTQLSHDPKAASKDDIIPVLNSWTHHKITLTTDGNGSISNLLAIYLLSNNVNDEILIDEIHFSETGKNPRIKDEVKSRIAELGIRSLRYPGGTLTDFFFWKDSAGTTEKRGEMMTYNTLETPVIGLHEFLDFCEANSITPLIQVNVLDSADNAADLVEYILGPSTSTQGLIRAANGKTDPWNTKLFEIGNEPVSFYKEINLAETGKNYAILASTVITKMKAKAAEIGATIQLGGISEAAFQIADWMTPADDTLKMLYYWNRDVFTGGGLSAKVDFAQGHFYASRYLHNDIEKDYRYILSGGEVLRKTLEDKVKPHTGSLPLWITEYHVTVEDDASKIIKPSYSNDYQSGLAIADMLIMMMNNEIKGAYIHNLAQENCWGLINYNQNWSLRPAGHVFKLFSPAAGETRLTISTDSTENYSIPASGGAGNVPSNFQYPLVSATATVNKSSGRPRVFLLNRDYTGSKTVNATLTGYIPGNAVQYLYTNSSVTADNESIPDNVTVTSSTVSFSNPFTVTLPAHSLMRLDFQ